jgi:hypothetical protein
MFDGTWDNSDGYVKTTSGLVDLSQGDKVCTSGAGTGVHCGITIRDLLSNFADDDGILTTIQGYKFGAAAAGEGDSGGPVLVPLSDGKHVRAAGMIQGANDGFLFGESLCGGSTRVGAKYTICSVYVEFTSMHTMINNISGSSLVTGP